MIKIGQEIKIVVAASKSRWHLKIVSPPLNCYQYYNKNGILEGESSDKIVKYYYRQTTDTNDSNPHYPKIASYVIDLYENSMKIFIFPVSFTSNVKKMISCPEDVFNFNWELLKTGISKETRYDIKKIEEPVEIKDDDMKLVKDIVENNPLHSVLFKNEKIYVSKPQVKFNRFDILDIDD